MINPAIPPLIDDMKSRLTTHFGVAAAPLARQQKKIGRLMPARYRRMVKVLSDAEIAMAHPKLSRQVGLEPVQKAHAELLPYLKTVSLADRRKSTAIDTALRIGLNLFILAALAAAFLIWRGLL